ncbi:unnamed protein product [Polarella glacialis]|uniref:Uncharacterized protein n=1 Tax=Polarella glacialis TaxID=89957 RepID=A0A813HXH2_POLGL|nr:unnamed protein product [Polarella glacialis]
MVEVASGGKVGRPFGGKGGKVGKGAKGGKGEKGGKREFGGKAGKGGKGLKGGKGDKGGKGKGAKGLKGGTSSGKGPADQRQYPQSSNIRSDEAIKRRAEKRGVTFEDQLKADVDRAKEERGKRKAEEKDKADIRAKKRKVDPAVSAKGFPADGAAKGSEKKSVSVAASVPSKPKQSEAPSKGPASGKNPPGAVAVAATKPKPQNSTPLAWPEQAGPERLAYNQQLRERHAADPESLTGEELERAKCLVERDARKKAKKQDVKDVHAKFVELRETRSERRKEAAIERKGVEGSGTPGGAAAKAAKADLKPEPTGKPKASGWLRPGKGAGRGGRGAGRGRGSIEAE